MQSKIGKLGGYINSGSHEGPRPVALLCQNFKVGQKPKVCKKRPKKVNIMSGATTYSLQFTLSHFFQNLSLHSSFLGLVLGNSLDQCDLCRLQMRWWPLHSCCWMVASEATTFINHNKILASKFGGNLHNEKLFYSLEI